MAVVHQEIHGNLIVLGKQPDGDSVRFRPSDLADLQKLAFAYRLRVSKDGTVQLRFDGVDAPETHYQGRAQPLGVESRDALLKHIGFQVTWRGNTVATSQPQEIPATIWAHMTEINGRVVCYVVVGNTARDSDTAVAMSLNAWLVGSGWCYPTFYVSTPLAHRRLLTDQAVAARNAQLGVWAKDMTPQFRLASQVDISPEGQLILPKLFRRCTDYLRDVRQGAFGGTLPDWLQLPDSDEDDGVVIDGAKHRLHDLVRQEGDGITFTADILSVIFIEK